MLLKNDDPSMTIGNLDFDLQGGFCLASTDKKFLAAVCFEADLEEHVGQRKSVEKLLVENYGSKRPGQREIMKTYKDVAKLKQASTTSVVTEIVETIQAEEPKKVMKHYKKGKRVDSSTAVPNEGTSMVATQPALSETAVTSASLQVTLPDAQKAIVSELSGPAAIEQSDKKKMAEEPLVADSDDKKPKLLASRPALPVALPERDTSKGFLPALPRLQDSGVCQYGNHS